MHKSTKPTRSRVNSLTNVQSNVQDALSRRAVASSSLIPLFQQTLLSRGDPREQSLQREILLDSMTSNSGGGSPLSRSRHDTTSSTLSLALSTTTVVVPIVNSSALGDREFRKSSRADSTDSTTSTLPGELLLYDPASHRSTQHGELPAETPIRLSPAPAGQTSSRLSLMQGTSGGSTNSGRSTGAAGKKINEFFLLSLLKITFLNVLFLSYRTDTGHKKPPPVSKTASVTMYRNPPNEVLLTPLNEVPGAR